MWRGITHGQGRDDRLFFSLIKSAQCHRSLSLALHCMHVLVQSCVCTCAYMYIMCCETVGYYWRIENLAINFSIAESPKLKPRQYFRYKVLDPASVPTKYQLFLDMATNKSKPWLSLSKGDHNQVWWHNQFFSNFQSRCWTCQRVECSRTLVCLSASRGWREGGRLGMSITLSLLWQPCIASLTNFKSPNPIPQILDPPL